MVLTDKTFNHTLFQFQIFSCVGLCWEGDAMEQDSCEVSQTSNEMNTFFVKAFNVLVFI